MSDGQASTALSAFAIAVTAVSNGRATLSWTAPTQNTDGSTLSNLSGYRIRYGTSAASLTNTIVINNASVTTYVVEDLAPATWYFAVTAVNSAGAKAATRTSRTSRSDRSLVVDDAHARVLGALRLLQRIDETARPRTRCRCA